MTATTNERVLAYLALFSGLAISAVAIYYSVAGLMAIFAAAVIPIIIMGTVLEISKLVATVWLKQNWKIAPWPIRIYLLVAIIVIMLITSMGIFGLLSKAHSDQSLVSGDVLAKIAIYDEKIKVAKDNIEANRKALKQMDEAVDQTMARSTTETGAERAVQVRRAQAKERARLLNEIQSEQKTITKLNEERAPIAAEVRKVEAEVGPIKYIAALIYGDNPDTNLLERAVRWVIILIVVVFDPLAIVLLLASQLSFQSLREKSNPVDQLKESHQPLDPEPLNEQLSNQSPSNDAAIDEFNVNETTHPYLYKRGGGFKDSTPMVYRPDTEESLSNENELKTDQPKTLSDVIQATQLREDVETHGYSSENNIVKVAGRTYSLEEFNRLMNMESLYVQNEEQSQSGLWNITQEEYLKTAMKKQQPKE